MNDVGANPDDYCAGILEDLWREGTAPSQDLFRHLAEVKGVDAREVPKKSQQELTELGFIFTANGQCKPACRLLENHVRGSDDGFGAVARMFGTGETYSANIRGILERRIAQIPRIDNDLFHMVERAIEDLPHHPHTSLNSLSHIEDKALEITWSRELDGEGKLSVTSIGYRTTPPRHDRFPISEMMKATPGNCQVTEAAN